MAHIGSNKYAQYDIGNINQSSYWTDIDITHDQNLYWMDSVLKLLHCDFPVFGMPKFLLLIWPTFWPFVRPLVLSKLQCFILSDTLSDLKSFELKKRSFPPILRMRLFINERQVKCSLDMGGSWSKLVNSALSLSINYNSYNIGLFTGEKLILNFR